MGYRTRDIREQISRILRELGWAVVLFLPGALFALLIAAHSAEVNNVPVSTYLWLILYIGSLGSGSYMFIHYMDEVRERSHSQRGSWRGRGILRIGYLIIFLGPLWLVILVIPRLVQLSRLMEDREDFK